MVQEVPAQAGAVEPGPLRPGLNAFMGIDPIVLGVSSVGSSSDWCCPGKTRLNTGPKALARTGLRVGRQAQMTAVLISAFDQFAIVTRSHVGSLE
jgi:hypothetical protein